MAQFNLRKELSSALTLDTPLLRGPLPRWQRKEAEALSDSCSHNASSQNNSMRGILSTSNANQSASSKTPGKKTPTGTPGNGKKSTTPGRSKTPNDTGDRFIPNRSGMQMDVAQYLVSQESQQSQSKSEDLDLGSSEYQRAMSENLSGDLSSFKILAYKHKARAAPEGHENGLKVLYSCSKTPCSTKKCSRFIPHAPERILDAPDIVDDYYLNLLDWSSGNLLAVALGGDVYLWNATTGDIHQLSELEEPGEYVCSVAWIPEGNVLAIGTSTAEIQLWDVEAMKRMRTMTSHSGRVGSLSWNSYIISSGSRSGHIHHSDVRIPSHLVGTLSGHTQEVCGLRWSPNGRYLASGSNDNTLNIWSAQTNSFTTESQPLYTFTQHQAAVKAISWCPWQPNVLASGGGTNDRSIRFWNCSLGTCINTVDTRSQVCGLVWSSEYKELLSGHGFSNNQLIIWKYPTMEKVAELTGHQARILGLSLSPDGTTVMSAGADETLRLWKCFAVDPEKRKATAKGIKGSASCTTSLAFTMR